ncbi:MAG: FAD-binding oxidoreductase [Maritimibacter sp.]|nr:FAD-binding oxidoreductase [Maritimibacter sp.]
MDFIEAAREIVGTAHVLTGADTARYASDWTGKYTSRPLCVVRPADTAQVSALMALANETATPVVPIGGNTGVSGGAQAQGAVLLSLERLNRIREIRAKARVAVVEAGVVLQRLHEATEPHGLTFPMTFGARGSATLGGMMATNAGGSGVLRYGNTRALVLGLEAVMPDGAVLDLMTALHKDNSGYDLRDLLIGAEGTLGVITAAVAKLVPLPRARATALLVLASLDDALGLLNTVQEATANAVEACEYMPGEYLDMLARLQPEMRQPLARNAVTLMLEIAAGSDREAAPGPDGVAPIAARLEELLAAEMEAGRVLDAVIARTEAQRREIWALREAAAEVQFATKPSVISDIALPLDRIPGFFDRVRAEIAVLDPEAWDIPVAHLGDGNIHFAVYPSRDAPDHLDRIMETVEEIVVDMGGSFSAEHGIGLSKKPSMARRKDPVALAVMRAIKAALDPQGIMNPGKVLPD